MVPSSELLNHCALWPSSQDQIKCRFLLQFVVPLPLEKVSHEIQLQACLKCGSTRANYGTHIVPEEITRNAKKKKKTYLIYNYICQKLQETAELSYLKPTSSSQMQGYWIMYHYWSKLNKDIICCPIYIYPPNRETLYSPEPQPLDFLLFPIHLMSLLCLNLTSLFVANYAM